MARFNLPDRRTDARLLGFLMVACALALPGCGKSGSASVDVVPVKGKVTVGGKPLTKGTIFFVPETGNAFKGRVQGPIDETGTYEAFTEDKPGAPPGQYIVCVFPEFPKLEPGEAAPKVVVQKATFSVPFHRKYMRPDTSPLKIEVVDNPQPGAYDLHLTKN